MKTLTLKTTLVSMLQKGDRVIIYQDPITRKKPEGTARLVRRLDNDENIGDQQYWKVHFESDPETECYHRFIAPVNHGVRAWEIIDDRKEAA